MDDREVVSELRKSARIAWLGQRPSLDRSTILDILVYTEVRGVARDKSMAETLEDVVFYGTKVPLELEWYEGEYLRFLRGWAAERRELGKNLLERIKAREQQPD
jgi:hypothetical protein